MLSIAFNKTFWVIPEVLNTNFFNVLMLIGFIVVL